MERAETKVTELSERVATQFEDLSPQLQKAARFMLDHPDDVALRSMRQLATQANIPAATFVRLARALGYGEYQNLRLLFQGRMREQSSNTSYIAKARDLQLRSKSDGPLDLIRDLFDADIRNLEQTFQNNDTDALIRATRLIEKSKRVFVLGQRSCYSIAFFFNYVYRLAHSNSVLLQNDGGIFANELRDIGRGDLLLSISLAPYTRSVVEATLYAHERGAKVLVITDDRLSTFGRIADEALIVAAGTPSFFHSMISLVSMSQALLALLVAKGGKDAMLAIKQSEKQVERFNPYWTDKSKKRSD